MPHHSGYFEKLIKFLIIIPLFAELIWLTGCATQEKTVNTPHEKEAVTVRDKRGITEESLKCITCHENRGVAHGWIADWEGSKHARNGVGCTDCHISYPQEQAIKEAIELEYFCTDDSNCEDKRVYRQVIAGNCGKCHIKQYNEFMKSRHSIGWKMAIEGAKYIKLSRDILSARCEQCHNIQFKCDSCHTRHTFSTLEAKTPEACRTCHTGTGHPHYDSYISSKHGVVYTASQANILRESQSVSSLRSPVCVTCHMPQGTHDISFGLAYGPVGGGAAYTYKDGNTADNAELTGRRDAMLSVCNACHSPAFSKKTLSAADAIHKGIEGIVNKAKDLVFELEREGLLRSSISEISNAQFHGHALILGSPQLFGSKSRVERFLYKLIFSASSAWKGAYHMNPDYTYLYGWTELEVNLNDIRDEAQRLRGEAELKRKMEIKLR